MGLNDRSNESAQSPGGAEGLSRRDVLITATVAASALAAAPDALADAAPAANFGAPVVELCVPAGALTLEQRSAMIKGLTEVVLRVTKRTPDPANRLYVAIVETAEGGFGVNGQVFVPPKP